MSESTELTKSKRCPFCGNEYNTGHKPSCYFRVRGKSDNEREAAWNYRPLEDALRARVTELETEIDQLTKENAIYEDALQQIDNWSQAYPLDVFPEPDFALVNKALIAAGISLSCVSAANMRHVIIGVEKITKAALKGGEG